MPRFWRSFRASRPIPPPCSSARRDILARLDEAIESAEKAIEVNPDNSYAHAMYSLCLELEGILYFG
jgi:hypothetical protein